MKFQRGEVARLGRQSSWGAGGECADDRLLIIGREFEAVQAPSQQAEGIHGARLLRCKRGWSALLRHGLE
jgi:hypothetical protein